MLVESPGNWCVAADNITLLGDSSFKRSLSESHPFSFDNCFDLFKPDESGPCQENLSAVFLAEELAE